MPPLPAADSVLKFAWQYTVEGQPNLNIVHALYDGTGEHQPDLDTIASTVADAFQAFLHPLQTADAADVGLEVTDLSASDALTSSAPRTGHGTHSGGMTPANVACCVSWKVHRRYRGGHPRTYIGGIPITAFSTERSFDAAYVTLANNGAGTFLAAINGAGTGDYGTLKMVSLSYFIDKAVRGTPVTDPIIGHSVNARPDSQRRRLGRVAG